MTVVMMMGFAAFASGEYGLLTQPKEVDGRRVM